MMKTVVITGASTGIGLATVKSCLEHGYTVIATARKPEDIDRLDNMGCSTVFLELSDEESVKKAAEEITKLANGHIDALFNNAGYGLQVALEDATWDALNEQFNSNVIGPVILSNQLLPCLQPGSKLIFNSSILGVITIPFRGPYCMSKHALESASDAYRLELENKGISVHVVQPGPIEADFRPNAFAKLQACLNGKETRLDYSNHMRRLETKALTKGTLPASAVSEIVVGIIQGKKTKTRYLVTRTAIIAAWAKKNNGRWIS